MTDSITIDSLAHRFIQEPDKRSEFIDSFDQDEFDHLARAMMQFCLIDYAKLSDDVQVVVFKMAEVMAMKELDVPFDINEITPF